MNDNEARTEVRKRYGEIARSGAGCCSADGAVADRGCGGSKCGQFTSGDAERIASAVGYSEEDLRSAPAGSNLGLGCGNPTALAQIEPGQTVLDLGSGAGFDCFLAVGRTGKTGTVIGVDMTPDMVERARANAKENGYDNVDFRLGEIEHLPVADGTVDLVISNCVINLSPDKPAVFAESLRVLKPGGRLLVSDIVLTGALPERVSESVDAYAGCVAGAAAKDEYLALIRAAGFEEVSVLSEIPFDSEMVVTSRGEEIAIPPGTVASVTVGATKAPRDAPA